VEVTFLVDADGVLTVTAREQRSGQQASIDVVPSHGLTRDQVKGIIRDSIVNAQQDFAARDMVEARNKAHNLVQGTRRVLAMPATRSTPAQRRGRGPALAGRGRSARGEDAAPRRPAADALGQKRQTLAGGVIGAAIKAELTRPGAPGGGPA